MVSNGEPLKRKNSVHAIECNDSLFMWSWASE